MCIVPFLSLRPKKRRASHKLRHIICRVFPPSCSCEAIVPRFCATACLYISFSCCVGNTVLGLAFKCRPNQYHPFFSQHQVDIFKPKNNKLITLLGKFNCYWHVNSTDVPASSASYRKKHTSKAWAFRRTPHSLAGADTEKNLTGFQPLIIINGIHRYIYGNFQFLNLNIRELLILGLFVKKNSAEFRHNRYSHWVVECIFLLGLSVLAFTAE